jgi:phosphonate transport system substrate-binding protein
MSRQRRLWLGPVAVLAATAILGSPAVAQEDPAELVIGFVPSREAGALVETIQPLADYLTETLGMPVTGIVTNDYTGLVTAMETGQAHIGALPPFGLV